MISEQEKTKFRSKIIDYAKNHGRDFPWRKTSNDLHALVAEIMLQQTSYYQVEEKYKEFVEDMKRPSDVIQASSEDIRYYFKGLGLVNRAEYVKAAAGYLASVEEPGFEGLMDVKGIGRYTANAFLSIHKGEKRPIVDGNVIRVFREELDIDESIGASDEEAWELAWELLPEEHVKTYNLGLIDYGAELYDGNP